MASLFQDDLISETAENPVDPNALSEEAALQLEESETPTGLGFSEEIPTGSAPKERSLIDNITRGLRGFGGGIQGGVEEVRADAFLRRGSGGSSKDAKSTQFDRVTKSFNAIQKAVESAGNFSGENRKTHLLQSAERLNSIQPGLGDVLKNLSNKPDDAARLLEEFPEDKVVQQMLRIDPTGALALKMMGTKEGLEGLEERSDNRQASTVTTKVFSQLQSFQSLASPELFKSLNGQQPTQSDLVKLNEELTNSPDEGKKSAALSANELRIAQKSKGQIFSQLGILTAPKEQEVLSADLKEQLKSSVKPGTVVNVREKGEIVNLMYQPDGKNLPDKATDVGGGYFEIGRGASAKEFFAAHNGENVRITKKADGTTEIDSSIQPVKKKGNAIDEVIAAEFKKEFGKKPPLEVPEDTASRFIKEKSTFPKGAQLTGKKHENGEFEVVDANGKVIGTFD